MKKQIALVLAAATVCSTLSAGAAAPVFAGEASLVVPNIKAESLDSYNLLLIGLIVSVLGVLWGLWAYTRVKKVEVHEAMASVGNTIFETCKTYLVQQGKFLLYQECNCRPGYKVCPCFHRSRSKMT